MARLRFSDEFLTSLSELDGRVEEAAWEKLSLVESFPGVGSALVEPSLRHAYGPGCLKVVAWGYDILYERRGNPSGPQELVDVLGIVGQRRVR